MKVLQVLFHQFQIDILRLIRGNLVYFEILLLLRLLLLRSKFVGCRHIELGEFKRLSNSQHTSGAVSVVAIVVIVTKTILVLARLHEQK